MGIWGSNNNNNDDQRNGDRANAPLLNDDASGSTTPRHVEADERTRLIQQPPPGHDGYLSPDDPAVCFSHHLEE